MPSVPDEAMRRLMSKVAEQIRDDPWGSDGRRVVVMAVDLEQEDLERNLRALIPKRTLNARLR